MLENNKAIVEIKEMLMRNLMVDTTELDDVKEKLREINERMTTKKQNFENSFLIASGETLQNLVDYEQLQSSVIDVNIEFERKKSYKAKYQEIMSKFNILKEVSRIIYQLYMSLKVTSKIMNEVTYSWNQFAKVTEQLFRRLIDRIKIQKAGTMQDQSMEREELSSKRSSMEPVDIEINNEFFSDRYLPLLHQTLMSNVKNDSKAILNFIISLRLSLMQEAITLEEYNLIMNLMIKQD